MDRRTLPVLSLLITAGLSGSVGLLLATPNGPVLPSQHINQVGDEVTPSDSASDVVSDSITPVDIYGSPEVSPTPTVQSSPTDIPAPVELPTPTPTPTKTESTPQPEPIETIGVVNTGGSKTPPPDPHPSPTATQSPSPEAPAPISPSQENNGTAGR